MNTPAHVAASLLIWRRESQWREALAVCGGAVLPDLPMFGFFAYQKWIGSTEQEIWSKLYFQPSWQLFFDVFNSIPLAVLIIVICLRSGHRWGYLLAASSLVHMICDLPLHHDDAHRHFLPLSNWRFASPFSYWDPRHFGRVFMTLEMILALAACAFVVRKGAQPMRRIASVLLVLYVCIVCLAMVFPPKAR